MILNSSRLTELSGFMCLLISLRMQRRATFVFPAPYWEESRGMTERCVSDNSKGIHVSTILYTVPWVSSNWKQWALSGNECSQLTVGAQRSRFSSE